MAWVPLSTTGGVPARFGTEPEEIKADMVSGNFFSGLGVPSVRGRTFNLEDEQKHTQVAILSYDYWTRRSCCRRPNVFHQGGAVCHRRCCSTELRGAGSRQLDGCVGSISDQRGHQALGCFARTNRV